MYSLDRSNSSSVLMAGNATYKTLCSRYIIKPDDGVGCSNNKVFSCWMEGHATYLISISDSPKCLLNRCLAVVKQLNGKVSTPRHQDRLTRVEFKTCNFLQVVIKCADHWMSLWVSRGVQTIWSWLCQHSVYVQDLIKKISKKIISSFQKLQ